VGRPGPRCVDDQARGAARRRANAVSRRPAEQRPRRATGGRSYS
jgi:hypothetical protein